MIAQPVNQEDDRSCGGRLVAAGGRVLPLRSAELRVDTKAGLARVRLQQRFANAYGEPLAVSYALPLPHDGAVSGYTFAIGDRRIVGEVDRRSAARERFEQALIEGHTAALLEQDRTSLFTQEIGNVPPGAEVVCEIVIDQRLRWLEQGRWEWRFPTVVAPRYLGHEGRVADAARVSQEVAEHGSPVLVSLELAIRDALAKGGRPMSPSHAITAAAEGGEFHVAFEPDDARLDRDVVVRWPVARPDTGVTIDTGRRQAGAPHSDRTYGLLTIIPPAPAETSESFARDLVVLLDTSGSMSGEPLDQARRVVWALIDTLADRDRLQMIAFSSTAQRWQPAPVAATAPMRRQSTAWLGALHASGSTEMLHGIIEALQPQRQDAQRQVVLVTDGLVGFESEVVLAIYKQLPAQSRLHVVGVATSHRRVLEATPPPASRGIGGTPRVRRCGVGPGAGGAAGHASQYVSSERDTRASPARRLFARARCRSRSGASMSERDVLIEAATSAWRPHAPDGTIRSHPAWHDLDAAGRSAVFEATAQSRVLEAALDPEGLSTTARAVLARLPGPAGPGSRP